MQIMAVSGANYLHGNRITAEALIFHWKKIMYNYGILALKTNLLLFKRFAPIENNYFG